MNGFLEITVDIEGEDVMLDIDIKTGKVIDLYTFRDAVLEYYSERLDDFKNLVTTSWKPTGNELFRHCPKSSIKRVLKTLQYAIMFHSQDLEENWDLINKFIAVYSLNINTSY